MAMAVFRLFIMSSSIFLLLASAADDDKYIATCHDETGRCDAGTASSLVHDLAQVVPGRSDQRYCNVQLATTGWNMYGYGYCSTSGRTTDSSTACGDCLTRAGAALVYKCRDQGGAGDVFGPMSWCYIKTGLTDEC